MSGAGDEGEEIGLVDGVDVAEAEGCWETELVDEV